jgi:hypothetical protein
VHIDVNAALLKLVFLKCHSNNYNTYNQIGLVALNCIGPQDMMGAVPQNQRSDMVSPARQTPISSRNNDPSSAVRGILDFES